MPRALCSPHCTSELFHPSGNAERRPGHNVGDTVSSHQDHKNMHLDYKPLKTSRKQCMYIQNLLIYTFTDYTCVFIFKAKVIYLVHWPDEFKKTKVEHLSCSSELVNTDFFAIYITRGGYNHNRELRHLGRITGQQVVFTQTKHNPANYSLFRYTEPNNMQKRDVWDWAMIRKE